MRGPLRAGNVARWLALVALVSPGEAEADGHLDVSVESSFAPEMKAADGWRELEVVTLATAGEVLCCIHTWAPTFFPRGRRIHQNL